MVKVGHGTRTPDGVVEQERRTTEVNPTRVSSAPGCGDPQPSDPRNLSTEKEASPLGTKGIATNGAIGRYDRGSWPYY